jgi:hypothetical protein
MNKEGEGGSFQLILLVCPSAFSHYKLYIYSRRFIKNIWE